MRKLSFCGIGILVLFGLLLAVGCSKSGEKASTPTKQPETPVSGGTGSTATEVEVVIQGFAFVPQAVTVVPGTTVRWTQKDSTPHTVTSDKGVFDSGSLSQGKTYSYKFTTAGTYEYHCSFHTYMKGTINVQPSGSSGY